LLLIVHPKNLNDDALYAIDQFVLGGRQGVVLVDPHSEASNAQPSMNPMMMMPMMRDTASALPTLFDAWGIEMPKDKVVGDRFLALGGQHRQGRAAADRRLRRLDRPQPRADQPTDVVTSDVSKLIFASPGALKQKDGAYHRLHAAAWTTDETQLIDADIMKFADPESLLKDFKSSGARQVIAARIAGPTKSAFPDGPPKPKPADKAEANRTASQARRPGGEEGRGQAEEKEGNPTPHLAESKGPINLVVVADTDFLDDRFWLQVQTSSAAGRRADCRQRDLLINAVDNLAGSSELIGLRAAQVDAAVHRGRSIAPRGRSQVPGQEKELQSKLEGAEKKSPRSASRPPRARRRAGLRGAEAGAGAVPRRGAGHPQAIARRAAQPQERHRAAVDRI